MILFPLGKTTHDEKVEGLLAKKGKNKVFTKTEN